MNGRARQWFKKNLTCCRRETASYEKKTKPCQTSTWHFTMKMTNCKSCSTRCSLDYSRQLRRMARFKAIYQNWPPSLTSWPRGYPAAPSCTGLSETCRSNMRLRCRHYRWVWRKLRKSLDIKMKRCGITKTWRAKPRKTLKNASVQLAI